MINIIICVILLVHTRLYKTVVNNIDAETNIGPDAVNRSALFNISTTLNRY